MSTAAATFRKTRSGEWVAFGPTTVVKVGEVTVAKRDGSTKTVTVGSVGKAFRADGVECRYGYITADAPQATVTHINSRRPSREMCDDCGERTARYDAADMSGISGRVCGVCYRSGALSFG